MAAVAVAAGAVAHADAGVVISDAAGRVAVPVDGADFSQVHTVGGASGDGWRWERRVLADGSIGFRHAVSGRCLDLSDPDDGGSGVVIRDCSAESASQRWERRGPALVNRDSGECATEITRVAADGTRDVALVGADCVPGDEAQAWRISPQ